MDRIPTPWKKSKNVLGEFSIHWGEKADRATTVATARTEAAADQIVQAVNSHEALAEACKLLIKSYGRDKYDPAVVAARAALKLAGVKP